MNTSVQMFKRGNENTQNGRLFEMRNYNGYEMRTNGSLFETTLTTWKGLKYRKVKWAE